MNKVQIKPTETGALVSAYKNNPAYGYITLQSEEMSVDGGWVNAFVVHFGRGPKALGNALAQMGQALLNVGLHAGAVGAHRTHQGDRKSTRLNSSHLKLSRMPSSA